MQVRLALVLTSVALVACSPRPGDPSTTDAGTGTTDAGQRADAGTRNDAGTVADAGMRNDAGTVADAAVRSDAGTFTDAGTATDAGVVADAAMGTDAGVVADAAMGTDAGTSCDGWVSNGECRPFTTCTLVDIEGTPTSDRVCLVDCELTWTDWGCCSLEGDTRTQTRTATVSREASPNGQPCAVGRTETRACETGAPSCACDTATGSNACGREPACEWLSESATCRLKPVDCVYSPWSAWTECSYPCDLGTQTRTRTVVTEAAHGGRPCTDPLVATQMCNGGTRCSCSIFAEEPTCTTYAGCAWDAGACTQSQASCDTITDETMCNTSPLCCEYVFGSCVPKTCS